MNEKSPEAEPQAAQTSGDAHAAEGEATAKPDYLKFVKNALVFFFFVPF